MGVARGCSRGLHEGAAQQKQQVHGGQQVRGKVPDVQF